LTPMTLTFDLVTQNH